MSVTTKCPGCGENVTADTSDYTVAALPREVLALHCHCGIDRLYEALTAEAKRADTRLYVGPLRLYSEANVHVNNEGMQCVGSLS